MAREGYVNLSTVGQLRIRQPGDSERMVHARRRFLATGAFDPLTDALIEVVSQESPHVVLDIGCGEGRHTRSMTADIVMGIDVAKTAAAAAARADSSGWYAVANAMRVPVPDESVDLVLSVFGPIVPFELARVVRRGGIVVAAHPKPAHLETLRTFVLAKNTGTRQTKPPLRNAKKWFRESERLSITFPIPIPNESVLGDLFGMTPYQWRAPIDIIDRLAALASARVEIFADLQVTIYTRTGQSWEVVAGRTPRDPAGAPAAGF